MRDFEFLHLATIIMGSFVECKPGYDSDNTEIVCCRRYTKRQIDRAKQFYKSIVAQSRYCGVLFKIEYGKLYICPLTIK